MNKRKKKKKGKRRKNRTEGKKRKLCHCVISGGCTNRLIPCRWLKRDVIHTRGKVNTLRLIHSDDALINFRLSFLTFPRISLSTCFHAINEQQRSVIDRNGANLTTIQVKTGRSWFGSVIHDQGKMICRVQIFMEMYIFINVIKKNMRNYGREWNF